MMSKRKNKQAAAMDKLSGSGADLNTPGLPSNAVNDGTKTEKSDAPDDLISNGAPIDPATQNAKHGAGVKQNLGVDVLHESYVAADTQ